MNKQNEERKKVYEKIAESCRAQCNDVAKSGWGWWDRRCAIANLHGMATLCDTYANSEAMGIDTVERDEPVGVSK